jgi:hypothetical protein
VELLLLLFQLRHQRGTGSNLTKLFSSPNALSPGKPFQPSLIFAGKTMVSTIQHTCMVYGLTYKYSTWHKLLANTLYDFVGALAKVRKKFYNTDFRYLTCKASISLRTK